MLFRSARLIGAPPGYVGYEEGGQLTEKVRRKPYCVVLFDEIEKAHPDVFNVLLQILEEGKLTDGLGRAVDFKNTIVVMTSNVGVLEVEDAERPSLGFSARSGVQDSAARSDAVREGLKAAFRPEFINRIDSIVIFEQLSREELHRIVDLEVAKVDRRLADREVTLTLSTSARDLILEKGFDPKFGVRPLRRTIEELIEDPLSEALIDGALPPRSTARFTARDGQLVLKPQTAKIATAVAPPAPKAPKRRSRKKPAIKQGETEGAPVA